MHAREVWDKAVELPLVAVDGVLHMSSALTGVFGSSLARAGNPNRYPDPAIHGENCMHCVRDVHARSYNAVCM